jgi:hypothetical protein
MLAAGTIMVLLPLLPLMLIGRPQAAPDSVAALKSARRAQAAFEATRRLSLPERPGGWSGICGQRIGRICYWYEAGEDNDSAPPEPARIREARARLLTALESAAGAIPGDEWILGQRVRYLLEDSQPGPAARLAEQCRAVAWWCEAVAGLVRHVTGDFAGADSTFAAALADMPVDERCRWSDLSPLLEGELADRYGRLDCDHRAAFETRWWWLAQPLYSLAGNDRRTEHFARVVMARIQEGRRTPFGYWADDLRDVLLRYGWPTWWTRDPSAYPMVESEPRITGHDPSPAFHFTPGARALDDPTSAKPEDWSLDTPQARERYAPPYAATFTYLEHQEAQFRRGDSCLVVAASDLSGDTLFARRAVSVALALAADERAIVAARDSGVAAAPRAVVAAAPCRPFVLSLEAVAPRERHVARARYGVTPPHRTLAHPAISDLLLFDPPTDSLPATLDAVLPRAHGSTRVPADRTLGVFWEVYGVDPAGGAVAVSLTLAPQGTGWLRRALGLVGPRRDVRLEWQDVPQDSSVAPRALVIDLAGLEPARYLIEVNVTPPGGKTLAARREIRIERP